MTTRQCPICKKHFIHLLKHTSPSTSCRLAFKLIASVSLPSMLQPNVHATSQHMSYLQGCDIDGENDHGIVDVHSSFDDVSQLLNSDTSDNDDNEDGTSSDDDALQVMEQPDVADDDNEAITTAVPTEGFKILTNTELSGGSGGFYFRFYDQLTWNPLVNQSLLYRKHLGCMSL